MEKEAVRMEKETIMMEKWIIRMGKETDRMGGICRLLKNLVKNYFFNYRKVLFLLGRKETACQD